MSNNLQNALLKLLLFIESGSWRSSVDNFLPWISPLIANKYMNAVNSSNMLDVEPYRERTCPFTWITYSKLKSPLLVW